MSVALKQADLPALYTHTEYLAMEEKSEEKHEYYQGNIIAMGAASIDHNRIVGNMLVTLYNAFENSDYTVFVSNLRIHIAKKDIFAYPDVLVIYGKPQLFQNRTDTVTNPQVIIEVLSKSTELYDRKEKFGAYWSLDGFAEYVLIDQYRHQVEYYRQVDDKMWELLVFTQLDDVLNLQSIAVEISLERIYKQVDINIIDN